MKYLIEGTLKVPGEVKFRESNIKIQNGGDTVFFEVDTLTDLFIKVIKAEQFKELKITCTAPQI